MTDHDDLHTELAALQTTANQIRDGQREIADRVSRIEAWKTGIDVVLFGDKRSGGTGLVQQARGLESMLTEWKTLKRALYAVAGTVLTVGGGWLLHVITG